MPYLQSSPSPLRAQNPVVIMTDTGAGHLPMCWCVPVINAFVFVFQLKMVQQVERLIIAEQKMEEQIQTMTRTTEEIQHVQQSIEQLSKPFKHEHVEHFYHPY